MVDVLIIGAGPAGIAAALQLKRFGLNPCIFEEFRPGGLLWNANRVENYPGFPGGIAGPDLVRAFLDQIQGIEIIQEPVTELTWENAYFHAKTPRGSFTARFAIIASGTKPCHFSGFDIPQELHTRVAYTIYDLLNAAGNKIIIAGGGDAAFDYAINLARKNTVIILNRSKRVKCLPQLWDKAQSCASICYRSGTVITSLAVQPPGGMTVECSSPRGQIEYQADYLIGAIGRVPQLDFVSASVLEQSSELVKKGILHFVGDVKNGMFRQTAIAVGDGVRAAMQIQQVVKENAHESDCFDG